MQSFLDYADELRIGVRFVRDHDAEPDKVFALVLDTPRWQREVPVEAMFNALHPEDGYPPPFEFKVNRGYTSWGAAGALQEVLIFVGGMAVEGAIQNALWDAMKALVARHRAEAADSEQASSGTPIEREFALSRARWQVESHFNIDEIGLALVAERHEPAGDEWTFEFTANEWRYAVTLQFPPGGVTLVSIERSATSP